MRRIPAVFVMLAAVALTACGSSAPDKVEAASNARPTTLATTTTTTTAPLTEADKIKQALKLDLGSYTHDVGGITVRWTLENLTDKEISAFQSILTASVVDQLGRPQSEVLRFECTTRPIGPHERITTQGPTDIKQDLPGFYAAEADCVTGWWEFNPYITSEAALDKALTDGLPVTVTAEVTRISFSDGTSLGTARG